MKYGMNTFLWSDNVTGEKYLPLFERFKKMGFDAVEPAIFDTDTAKFAELGRHFENMGLERTAVTALSPDHNLIGQDAQVRAAGLEHLKRAIDCCHAMGSKLLAGPIYAALGVFSGAGPTKQEWDWAVEGLKAASEHAAQADVMLAPEFLNRFELYLLNCSVDAHRMVQDVDHPNFRMMYDTFHANIEEKNIEDAITGCAEVLIHVHISENDRSTPGKGLVQWKETFAALKKVNYSGYLTIEAFGQGLGDLAAATKIWRKMFEDEELLAEEGLAFMKQSWG